MNQDYGLRELVVIDSVVIIVFAPASSTQRTCGNPCDAPATTVVRVTAVTCDGTLTSLPRTSDEPEPEPEPDRTYGLPVGVSGRSTTSETSAMPGRRCRS